MTRGWRQAAGVTLMSVALIGASGVAHGAAAKHPKLPAGFPKPPHSKVLSAQIYGAESVYTMTVKTEPQAYKFWIKALPDAGYTVNKKKSKSKFGLGGILFSGNGYTAKGTAIAINKRMVTISLYKG